MSCKLHPTYTGQRPPRTKVAKGCTCMQTFLMLQRSTIEREHMRGRINGEQRRKRLEELNSYDSKASSS